MNQTLKYLLFGLLILGLIAVFAFSNILKGVEVGSVFAALSAGFATFKSKIFHSSTDLNEQLENVENEHNAKREEWKNIREEFETKYALLQSRMDLMDAKSARILQNLKLLNKAQKQALTQDQNASNSDLLDFLNQ
jgi:Skp family chaperone for outer membrane proteins